MKRSGRIPEKERLGIRVAELSKVVTSLPELKALLEKNGFETYERKQLLTGIWNDKKTRKYRLRTLGIDTDHLDRMITKEKERLAQLKRNRKNINKDREL